MSYCLIYRMVLGYNEDANIPVYDWCSTIKSVRDILPILLKPPELKRTCSRVPTAVSHNVCFLLDTSKLNRHEDWKCDDMGSWRNNGVQNHLLPFEIGGSVEEHALRRIYLKNKSSSDLKKIVTFLEGIRLTIIHD